MPIQTSLIMIRRMLSVFISIAVSTAAFGQSKTVIGIAPFKSGASQNSNNVISVQETVSDMFSRNKRLTLVEKDKMTQVKVDSSAEAVSPQLLEQAKSTGAQYVITGTVSKAAVEIKQTNIPVIGVTTANVAEITFTMSVIDVARAEVVATSTFNGSGKGKIAFEEALKDLRPQIERFIKDNFKITVSIAEIEEKNSNGGAAKVLIVAGSLLGVKELDEFRVYELTELTVDGKKMTRKKTLGKIAVSKVEDENFSVCLVQEGGIDIAKKVEEGAKIKCEMITE
jgi:TolB-like protein